jgi:O-acetyl-ADP-ribose deacetylase
MQQHFILMIGQQKILETIAMSQMKIIRGNIIELSVDVIVNSAHPTLLAGGGVSGAIHRAAGPELETAAKPLGPIDPGHAVTKKAFDLTAKYVIHAVAPRYLRKTHEEEIMLVKTYVSALTEFGKLDGMKSLAFPAMGTGIYGWPLDTAARIAVAALKDCSVEELVICVFDEVAEQAFQKAVEEY